MKKRRQLNHVCGAQQSVSSNAILQSNPRSNHNEGTILADCRSCSDDELLYLRTLLTPLVSSPLRSLEKHNNLRLPNGYTYKGLTPGTPG